MKPLDPLALPLEGVRLIEASAGTGKTYTLTTLVLRLVLERRLRLEQILVVTFTRAATSELRDRVRRRLGEALAAFERGHSDDPVLAALVARPELVGVAPRLLDEARRSVDQAAIFTIHGYCQRVLDELALSSGRRLDVRLVADLSTEIADLVHDFWARELAGASDARLQAARDAGLNVAGLDRLTRIATTFTDARVLPAPRAAVDPDPLVAAYVAARARVAAAWRGERARVLRLLEDSDLSRQRYKADQCRRYADAVDRLVADRREALGPSDGDLRRLAASALASDVNKGGRPAPEHPVFAALDELALARRAAAEALSTWAEGLAHRLVDWTREELPRRKARAGIESYDDLLASLHAALTCPGGDELAARIRARHPVLLIDEFQDTDRVQYGAFRRTHVAPGATLFLIGDPKQAIYGFRGADVYTYLAAARDAADDGSTLSVNHRSDPVLVRAVNTLFGRHTAPFKDRAIRYHAAQARPGAVDRLHIEGRAAAGLSLRLLPTLRPRDLPRVVAADVARLLASGATIDGRPIVAGDIAVLTRANRPAAAIQDELRELGIPGVLQGDANVLDSSDAEELGRVLRAVAAPRSARRVRAALATRTLGVSAEELDRLEQDELGYAAWIERLTRARERWHRSGVANALRALFDQHRVAERLLPCPDGERRVTNLRHLVELLHDAERTSHLGVEALSVWFDEVRTDDDARIDVAADAVQLRLESDRHAVKLLTMHKSKGLEYPVVFLPYLLSTHSDDKPFPRHQDPDDDHRLVVRLKRDGDDRASALHQQQQRAEGLRLAYVGITRAVHRCHVYWGKLIGGSGWSPLLDLLHGHEVLDFADVTGRLKELDGPRRLREAQALAAASQGSIDVVELDPDEPPPPYHVTHDVSASDLAAPSVTRRHDLTFRVSSFSALTRRDEAHADVLGVDRDQAEVDALDVVVSAPSEIVLAEFPRGPAAGELVHAVFEHHDFTASSPAALAALVEHERRSRGFAADTAEPLARAVEDVLATPLDGADLRLARVPLARRLSELEFTFPVGEASPQARLRPSGLARVFAEHPSPEVVPDYPDLLRRLEFPALAGFLRGFIDLVFELDGRWYVVDWKSNHLGDRHADYSVDSLALEMARHHYYLQYHLYVLALHRHLQLTLPDYQYERHLGGAYYLFVRGMSPRRADGAGIFFERPSAARIRALSALVSGEGAS